MYSLYKNAKLLVLSLCLLSLAVCFSDANAQCDLNGIYFSEVLPDPNDTGGFNYDTDGDGSANTEDEFLELTNSTGAPVDVSGWTLYYEGGTADVGVELITFPGAVGSNTTCIPANGSFVLINNWQNEPEPAGWYEYNDGSTSGVLGNGGEVIVMCDNAATNTCIKMVYNGQTGAIEPAGSTVTCTEDFGSDNAGQSIMNDNAGTFTVGTPDPVATASACVASACTQTIDSPAAVMQNICDGDAADTGAAELSIAYSGDGSVFTIAWYTDPGFTTPYVAGTALSAVPGCTSTATTLYAQATCSDDGSTVSAGTLTANVYPTAIPFTVVNNGCDVEISDDCGFAVSYSISVTTDVAGGYTDGDTGTSYACPTAQPTEAGVVTYTITDPDANRPAACNGIQVMVPFNCGAVCNPSISASPASINVTQ